MLRLSMSEPTPSQTAAARFALELYVKIIPGDANALAALATLLASDFLNRVNEAENNPAAARYMVVQADERVQQALGIDNTLAAAHYANGLVRRAQNSFAEAQQEFAVVAAGLAQADPKWAAARAHEGNEWINLGKLNEGVKLAREAIAQDDTNGIIHWIVGRGLFFLRNYQDAIIHLEKSVSLRKELWYNRLYLISAYARLLPPSQEIEGALEKFRETFPIFTRDTLTRYENDMPNPNLSLDEFHAGLDDAGFTH